MSEYGLLIGNSISIACIIIVCSYLVTILERKEIKPVRAIFDKIMHKDSVMLKKMLINWPFILLIPFIGTCLLIATVLIGQLSHGQFKVRADIQQLSTPFYWIVGLASLITIDRYQKRKTKKD